MSSELLQIIEQIKSNTTVTTIDLSGNGIGAEGCSSLAKALETNTTVTTIDLGWNNIGDEGWKQIVVAIKKQVGKYFYPTLISIIDK